MQTDVLLYDKPVNCLNINKKVNIQSPKRIP